MRNQIINFRKDLLQNLPILGQRYFVSDSKLSGLRLVIYPSGVKTFILYRKVKDKPVRIKIGRLTDVTLNRPVTKQNDLVHLLHPAETHTEIGWPPDAR